MADLSRAMFVAAVLIRSDSLYNYFSIIIIIIIFQMIIRTLFDVVVQFAGNILCQSQLTPFL